MKKILIGLALLLFCNCAHAITLQLIVNKEDRVKVGTIGYRLLNANRISKNITFSVKSAKYDEARAYHRVGLVEVTNSLIKSMDSDDELAAVLAHEISHSIDYSTGIFKGYFSPIAKGLSPRKYEYKADKRAVDYLVKAGYNPLAVIVMINKMEPQTRYEWCHSHPLSTKRMMEVYEYIYTKYPQYLVNNEYINNGAYQNFLILSRENRLKLEEKIKTGSKRKVNYL